MDATSTVEGFALMVRKRYSCVGVDVQTCLCSVFLGIEGYHEELLQTGHGLHGICWTQLCKLLCDPCDLTFAFWSLSGASCSTPGSRES